MKARVFVGFVLVFVVGFAGWGGTVTMDVLPPGQQCDNAIQITFTTPVDMGLIDADSITGDLLDADDVVVYLESCDAPMAIERGEACSADLTAEIYIQMLSVIGSVRPEAFEWRGGDQTEFAPFPGMGIWVPVATVPADQDVWSTNLKFRYAASLADPPGVYGVRLRFRMEYPDLPDDLQELYRAEWEIVVMWNTAEWVVLLVHEAVSLGTIGPELFDPPDRFGALESFGHPVLVACNRPGGVELFVRALTAVFPTEFAGGLASICKDFEIRVDGGEFTTVSQTSQKLGELAGPGWRRYSVDYRYQVDVQDVPGEYELVLEYTVTAP